MDRAHPGVRRRGGGRRRPGYVGSRLGGSPVAVLLAAVAVGSVVGVRLTQGPVGGPITRPVAKVVVFGAACGGLAVGRPGVGRDRAPGLLRGRSTPSPSSRQSGRWCRHLRPARSVSAHRVRVLGRTSLEGQDVRVDDVPVPDLDRPAQRLVGVPRRGPSSIGRTNGISARLFSHVADSQRYDGLWSTP